MTTIRSLKRTALPFCFGLLMIASASQTVAAQQRTPTRADHLASQIQNFYDQTQTVQAAFYQTHYNRLYRRVSRSRGVLTIAKPGRLRFDYLGGNGKVVVSNGQHLTIYEPDDVDGAGQYFRRPVQENALPSALAFLTGQSQITQDFRYRLRDSSQFRWQGQVLELRPHENNASYRRIFLFTRSELPGVVRRIMIQDHEGNLNRFDLLRTRFNRTIHDSRFELDIPHGARIL